MTLLAIVDTETNGLLTAKREKDGSVHPPLDKLHTITLILRDASDPNIPDRKISAADQKEYTPGNSSRGWERMNLIDAIKLIEQADIRVGHNWQDFDERAIKLVYPWYSPKEGSKIVDTLLLSRLIYPDIGRKGPNNHKLYPFEKKMHSLKAWGKRLGIYKGDYDGGWLYWSEDMQKYGEQDTEVLDVLFKFLWSKKPATTAIDLEHEFAAIIRRLESRGWCFDIEKAHTLLAELQTKEATLETSLISSFEEWWEYGRKANTNATAYGRKSYEFAEDDEDAEDEEEQARRRALWNSNKEYGEVVIPTKSRAVKQVGHPNVTEERVSPKTGNQLKPYIGPPKAHYICGHPYTPINRS